MFPNRIILQSPFVDKTLVSYGIIAFAQDTSRWLLVRRRHSPDFIFFMRGSYRKSEIPRLLLGCSSLELSKLNDILQGFTTFEHVFHETISNFRRDFEYANERFQDSLPSLRLVLPRISGESTTEWLWPKGRLHARYETPYVCAVREFCEETGLSIGNKSTYRDSESPYLASTKSITESFRSNNGYIYETRCWVYIFPYEITTPAIDNLDSPGEIGECRWVSEDEAASLLKSNKYDVLKEAKSIIESRLSSDLPPKSARLTRSLSAP